MKAPFRFPTRTRTRRSSTFFRPQFEELESRLVPDGLPLSNISLTSPISIAPGNSGDLHGSATTTSNPSGSLSSSTTTSNSALANAVAKGWLRAGSTASTISTPSNTQANSSSGVSVEMSVDDASSISAGASNAIFPDSGGTYTFPVGQTVTSSDNAGTSPFDITNPAVSETIELISFQVQPLQNRQPFTLLRS